MLHDIMTTTTCKAITSKYINLNTQKYCNYDTTILNFKTISDKSITISDKYYNIVQPQCVVLVMK